MTNTTTRSFYNLIRSTMQVPLQMTSADHTTFREHFFLPRLNETSFNRVNAHCYLGINFKDSSSRYFQLFDYSLDYTNFIQSTEQTSNCKRKRTYAFKYPETSQLQKTKEAVRIEIKRWRGHGHNFTLPR